MSDTAEKIGDEGLVERSTKQMAADTSVRVYLVRIVGIELSSTRGSINNSSGRSAKNEPQERTRSCMDVWLVLSMPSMNSRT